MAAKKYMPSIQGELFKSSSLKMIMAMVILLNMKSFHLAPRKRNMNPGPMCFSPIAIFVPIYFVVVLGIFTIF